MKKKSFLILLLVVCVGYLIPTGVFAKEYNIYNNIFINYRIKSDNDSLNYRIYDFSGIINYYSKYDHESQEYYFEEKVINYRARYWDDRDFYGINAGNDNFLFFKNYHIELLNSDTYSVVNTVMNNYNIHGSCYQRYYTDWDGCNFYDYIPLVLEETTSGQKKIIFAFNNLYGKLFDSSNNYFSGFVLVNGTDVDNEINNFIRDYGYDSNEIVEFTNNKVYNYSDKLWNELNNMKIASSEIDEQVADIISETTDNKTIYSKYKSNVNYKFKVNNGNGMKFNLHDVGNVFNFSSTYDKDSDTYSIVDNSSDNDYQDGIKNFSEIIINEVKNGNFSELASKYNSITSDSCSSDSCDITTYIPLILEGENNGEMAKQIVLGLMNIQYREDSGNDYYDVSLNVYNNTCELLNSNIDLDMNKLINLSRSIEEDYSNDLMDKYSNGSISLDDISKDEDINSLKDKYCENVPVILLRKISNPKTWNSGIIVLIISMIMVIGSGMFIIKKKV